MKVEVKRYNDNGDATVGLLFIDGEFKGYTLEDEERTKKVFGETRIPEGTYKIKLRTEGRLHQKYASKFPDVHKGMLHIIDVPNFQYILIHIGNTDEDTAGCLLIGSYPSADGNKISQSTIKYLEVYPVIRDAILRGEPVTITYTKIYGNSN